MTRLLALAVLLAGTPDLPAQSPPTFRVLVLDALDGKPQPNVEIFYSCEGQGFVPQNRTMTSQNGLAEVPFLCDAGAKIELGATPPPGKYECGGFPGAALREIQSSGFISKPNNDGFWCPARVSRKLKPVPGQILLFVKKPSWLQRHWPTGPDG